MDRDQTCTAMWHQSTCQEKTRHLANGPSSSTKINDSGTMTYMLAWIESLTVINSIFLHDIKKLASFVTVEWFTSAEAALFKDYDNQKTDQWSVIISHAQLSYDHFIFLTMMKGMN